MSSLRQVLDKHWVFDPRVGDAVQSDNPALILGMIATAWDHPVDWPSVAALADFYDDPVEPAEGFG